MNPHYEVLVVGAGHAGCEAALASARLGVPTALISMDTRAMGRMSCNPSIGGIAKSHMVCELDALGGEMARNADYSGLQFRTLNTRKGPAVQAHRVQCDKAAYARRIQAVLKASPHLDLLEALGFSMKLEIEPRERAKHKILSVVYPDSAQTTTRIEPVVHLAPIMSYIFEEAVSLYDYDVDMTRTDTPEEAIYFSQTSKGYKEDS